MTFVSLTFLISVGGLCGLHTCLVRKNQTTIENAFPPPILGVERRVRAAFRRSTFSENFQLVFGENSLLWFIPVHSSSASGVDHVVSHVDLESGMGYTDYEKKSMFYLPREAAGDESEAGEADSHRQSYGASELIGEGHASGDITEHSARETSPSRSALDTFGQTGRLVETPHAGWDDGDESEDIPLV
eukprot:m.111286 g.111286  ORF g.111286 m.111286 type:complete len:188 (-) comp13438_c0_seq2:295-858(-)